MIFSNTKKSTKVSNLLSLLVLVLLASCEKQEIVNSLPQSSEHQQNVGDKSQRNEISELSIVAHNASEKMFEDGESLIEMTDEARRFNVAEVLRIRLVGTDSIEVANFAPLEIKDITVTMQHGDDPIIDLFHIDRIGAHVFKRIHYPVNLSDGMTAAQVKLDYKGDSPLIQKLKKIRAVSWGIKPTDFDQNNDPKDNWKDTPQAKDFRLMTGMMINAAYIMMDPDLISQLQDDVILKDDGKTRLTAEEKEKDINKLRAISQVDVGVVDASSSSVGLAGIGVYGLAEKLYKESYNWGASVLGHELGHMLGYNHGSNMTYPQLIEGRSQGFGVVVQRLWNKALQNGELPVDARAYYMQTDLK